MSGERRPASHAASPSQAPASSRAPLAFAVPPPYRLPSPPPGFVGRGAAVEQLREALEHAPVALVWGADGLGKTALVQHVVHHCFPARARRTVRVELRPSDPPGYARVLVLRALAEALRLPHVDWPGLLSDPAALLATAVDLAEQGDVWVVLEDLHHDASVPHVASEVLATVGRYARHSRWIGTCRDAPAPALAPHAIALAPMSAAELAELLRARAPDVAARAVPGAVAVAAGSPWRLCYHAGSDAEALWSRLPPAGTALLEALALFDQPVALDALSAVTPLPPDATLEALAARGVIEWTPSHCRLHDLARPIVRAVVPPAPLAHRAHAADALADAAAPQTALEAARLYLADGDLDAAAELFARRGDAWLAEGCAPRLRPWLADVRDRRFRPWALRCAAAVGDLAAVVGVDAHRAVTQEERLIQAEALQRAGHAREAAALAARVAAETSDAVPAFRAGLVHALARAQLGERDAALAQLRALTPPDGDAGAAALRDAHLAEALARWGEYAEARAVLERLDERALAALEPAVAWAVRRPAAAALYRVGRLRPAARLLVGAGGQADARALYTTRDEIAQRAVIASAMGRLDAAQALLQRLERTGGSRGSLRVDALLAECAVRIAAGEMPGIERTVADLVATAEAAGRPDGLLRAELIRHQLAMLHGAPAPAAIPHEPTADAALTQLLAITRWRHARRQGEAVRDDAPELRVGADDPVQLRVAAGVAAAEAGILANDAARGLEAATAALALAHEHGWDVLAAEALAARCEALLLLGRRDDLTRAAADLAAAAAAMPSRRLRVVAALFRAAVASPACDPVVLATLTTQHDVAPTPARRAAMLLGQPVAHSDALDRLVVAAIQQRIPPAAVAVVAEAPSEWGLDVAQRAVWLPGGRRVDLAARDREWRLLETLAEHGGRASKEQLVRGVWGVTEYQAGRHHKQLQSLVRRLRVLIEDLPATPTRLVTLADGYGFGARGPR